MSFCFFGNAAAGSLQDDNCKSLNLPVPLPDTWIRCMRHSGTFGNTECDTVSAYQYHTSRKIVTVGFLKPPPRILLLDNVLGEMGNPFGPSVL